MTAWGSDVEKERWRRIHVLLWAYAYEFMSDSLVDDHTFDKTCYEIDLKISTGNRKMDNWFRKHFTPYTGQWIHSLPREERNKISYKYEQLKKGA